MLKKGIVLVLYSAIFIVGLILVLCSESLAYRQARVVDPYNPTISTVNMDVLQRKMAPIIVTGGILALVSGNGIVLTLIRKD